MTKIEETVLELQSIEDRDTVVDALITILTEMKNADDGNISVSYDNIGIDITKNSIDIVDIKNSKSILTLIKEN